MKRFFILMGIAWISFPLFSQYKAIVELHKSSMLSVHVRTNLMGFTLKQDGSRLANAPVQVAATIRDESLFVDRNMLMVKVKEFESDLPPAVGEFCRLMKVDQYPCMCIRLVSYKPDKTEITETGNGKATFDITITGVTRRYAFPVHLMKCGEDLRIMGKRNISILDFGLEPPKAVLGLINVNDVIGIDLNLLCRLRLTDESS